MLTHLSRYLFIIIIIRPINIRTPLTRKSSCILATCINMYRISPFEHLLSNDRLVSKEGQVKRGHYDHLPLNNESRLSAGARQSLKL